MLKIRNIFYIDKCNRNTIDKILSELKSSYLLDTNWYMEDEDNMIKIGFFYNYQENNFRTCISSSNIRYRKVEA